MDGPSTRHLGPLRTARLAPNDPDRGIGAVAGNQIPPVPFHAGDSGHRHAVAVASPPAADDRRDDTGLDQMFDAAVGIDEIVGIDHTEVAGQVGLPSFIFPARLKHALIGIGSADDLHHGESLGLAVGGQFLEAFPGHAIAQVLPPGVGQPQKWGAVGVLEMTFVPGHTEKAMLE
jgi:hypothetical protein